MTKTLKLVPRPAEILLAVGGSVPGADVVGVGGYRNWGDARNHYMVHLSDGRTVGVVLKDQRTQAAADWLEWCHRFRVDGWATLVPDAVPPARMTHNGVDVSRVASGWAAANVFAETHASIKKHCGPVVCGGCGRVLGDDDRWRGCATPAVPECRTAGTRYRDRAPVGVTLTIEDVCAIHGIGFTPLVAGKAVPDDMRY